MKKYVKLYCAVLCTVLCMTAAAVAEKTSIPSLYRYVLDNGLQLFVAENHTAPLASVRLAVRGGSFAQDVETTGMFHLFEHMMFEGNELYPDVISMDKAAKDMGAVGKNGFTSIDYVTYLFTIPSDQLYKGLEYWSYALRKPRLTEKSFEVEKKIVISEIEGTFSEPNTIRLYGLSQTLFPEYPWRLDVSGTAGLINDVTAAQLRHMLDTYYIPNNSAIFVGGDVNPDQVFEYVKELYGDWKRGTYPFTADRSHASGTPLSNTEYRVFVNNRMSDSYARVNVMFRGPDGAYDSDDIYAGDVFDKLIDTPESGFKKLLLSNDELKIPDSDYISSSAVTMRESSLIDFVGCLFEPESGLAERAKLFQSCIVDQFVPQVLADKRYFTADEFKQVKQSIKDAGIYRSETASGLLDSVWNWWQITDDNFYFTYEEHIKKVKKADIDAFLRSYVQGKHPLVIVTVSPAVYEAQKADFAAAGFTEITSDNAFWWKNPRYADLVKGAE